MQRAKGILLPLAVGAPAINNKPPLQRLSTSDVEIQLIVKCKMLKSLYCQTASKICLKDPRYEGNTMVLGCADVGRGGEFDRQIQLVEDKEDHIMMHPFRVNFHKEGEELALLISKQIIDFSLFAVGKTRFVRNEKLEQVIEGRAEEWGPLSMDKSERMMLQPQNTNFPVIGLWISSHQPISNCTNLVKLASYVLEKSPKKCFFSSEARKFFYLVRVNPDKSMPELFLVEWKLNGEVDKSICVNKKDAFTMAEISLGSQEKSALQFTLRSDEKVPEPLLNITCSPIKFPSSPAETTRSSMPDSPRFKLDNSGLLEQECASLKRLTREQQIEINDLRAEVLRLTGELRQCKRHKHYYDSQELTTSMASFRENEGKRLTRSDLNYDQPSLPNCEEHEDKAMEAWEKFQIVQPQSI